MTAFKTAIALVATMALSGCVESSLVARTRLDLEHGLPGASFEPEFAMRLGRLSMAVLKPVAVWALRGEGDEADLVRKIRRVDLAVYEVESFPEAVDGHRLAVLERRLGRRGWSKVLRAREEDEVTWVFNREDDAGEIRDLFVISVDGAEMVMVRVGGRIDQALADLIADDPGGFGVSLGG